MTMKLLVLAILACSLGVATLMPSPSASAHRSGCHTKHACPSDHATYRWGPKHLLCVKPTSDKRTAAFKIKVKYAGLTYYCKR
jgi:hypothetical protein